MPWYNIPWHPTRINPLLHPNVETMIRMAMIYVPDFPKITWEAATAILSFSACAISFNGKYSNIHQVGTNINNGYNQRAEEKGKADIFLWVFYFAGNKSYIIPGITAEIQIQPWPQQFLQTSAAPPIELILKPKDGLQTSFKVVLVAVQAADQLACHTSGRKAMNPAMISPNKRQQFGRSKNILNPFASFNSACIGIR